jgi:hypothetical protein
VISHEALSDLRKIDHYFKMKKESIGDPDIYLGSKLRKVVLSNGVHAWMISPTKYIKEAINNVERHLEREYGSKLPKRLSGPLPNNYRPEVDITPELNAEELSYYQSQIRALRYKLRMMGIPIEEPIFCFGDNMSVIHNTQRPESTLKKTTNSICYHFCRESVAMGETMTAHIRSENNPADICTKLNPGGIKRDRICDMIIHYYNGEELAG